MSDLTSHLLNEMALQYQLYLYVLSWINIITDCLLVNMVSIVHEFLALFHESLI